MGGGGVWTPVSEGRETGLDSNVLWKVITEGTGSGLKEEGARYSGFWRKLVNSIFGLREGQQSQDTLECCHGARQYDSCVCLVLFCCCLFLFCFVVVCFCFVLVWFGLFLPRWAAGNSRPSASSTLYGPAMAASCSRWMTRSTSLWPRWRRDLLSL